MSWININRTYTKTSARVSKETSPILVTRVADNNLEFINKKLLPVCPGKTTRRKKRRMKQIKKTRMAILKLFALHPQKQKMAIIMILLIIIIINISLLITTLSQKLFIVSFPLYSLADLSHKTGKSFTFWASLSSSVIFRKKNSSEVFCQKCILANFTKLTGKHLCRNFFSNDKIVDRRPATLGKTNSSKGYSISSAKFLRRRFLLSNSRRQLLGKAIFNKALVS